MQKLKTERDREKAKAKRSEKQPEEGQWRPIPAVNIVEVGEEKDSTDEESDQHESPVHFVK